MLHVLIASHLSYTNLSTIPRCWNTTDGSMYKTGWWIVARTYLTPIREDSEFEPALFQRSALSPFSNSLWKCPLHLQGASVQFSRLRPEPTRSSAVSCIHAHRLHRVDGHCTLNKAAGVNCTGFNERRSAHPFYPSGRMAATLDCL